MEKSTYTLLPFRVKHSPEMSLSGSAVTTCSYAKVRASTTWNLEWCSEKAIRSVSPLLNLTTRQAFLS